MKLASIPEKVKALPTRGAGKSSKDHILGFAGIPSSPSSLKVTVKLACSTATSMSRAHQASSPMNMIGGQCSELVGITVTFAEAVSGVCWSVAVTVAV